MNCGKCGAEMFKAKLAGAQFMEIFLFNKKKGLFEGEKRSTVSCYVCPECGHVELTADDPKHLRID